MSEKLYLALENGSVFEGRSFGAKGNIIGEIVFTTGMTGYLETLTDPSYYGQIVLQTFPLIGNYGIIPDDFESDCIGATAYIVKYLCQYPSNFRSEEDLDTFLCKKGIIGLHGIDTRALTKMIREQGVVNGQISTQAPSPSEMNQIQAYHITNALSAVSSKERKFYAGENANYTVALMDFGMKHNILQELCNHGCNVWVFPYDSKPDEILSVSPDGIMLSNGPGDPADNVDVIQTIAKLLQTNIPLFGICLGHQLLALANGFATGKLKYGHRGANQPVKDMQTGRVYITSQNHGYVVLSDSIQDTIAEEWFVNVNDGSCEGLLYKNAPAFSVQFHPEACAGPHDTVFLFDRFIQIMEERACRATSR